VRRIYCIGRNYAAHAREMGSDPTREPPFFFQKPTDAVQLAPPGETIDHPYPTLTKNYHYEVELVAALARGGRDVSPERALDLVYAYTVGLDMTRRDLQRAMGDEKKPWEIGKSFDRSAVLGPIHPATKTGHFAKGAISLAVNGNVKQNSNLQNMIWSVAEQISKLSEAGSPTTTRRCNMIRPTPIPGTTVARPDCGSATRKARSPTSKRRSSCVRICAPHAKACSSSA
jgi:fumarylpyruvate hydrolase